MQAMVVIFDFLLGCHHGHLSRVFTIDGQTYKVCCDCGAKFNYSLENMCIERPTRALGAARNVVLMEDRRSREKKSLPQCRPDALFSLQKTILGGSSATLR